MAVVYWGTPRNRRLVIVCIILIALIIIGGLLAVALHKKGQVQQQTINQPATSTSISKTQRSTPSTVTLNTVLQTDDNPAANGITYTTDSSSQPAPGWFVVNVTAVSSAGSFKQIAILQQKSSSGKPELLAGPDTSFPIDFLQSLHIPQVVINAVPVYTP